MMHNKSIDYSSQYGRTESNSMKNKKVGIALGVTFLLLLVIIASEVV
jgi:tetrahydromethanopterin S-methyltransferase subunit F